MKKYTKFLALMGFALVMSACQEDNIIPEAPALPGDEIIFGATGAFESGDKGTRTIYGDVYEDSYGKYIQVKWVKGSDRMDIACPQSATAGNIKIAEYKVMDESNSVVKDTFDLDEELDSIRIEDSSVAATLQRQGNAGLQWSTADTHHFFASYPSKAMVSEKLQGIISQEQINSLGMTLDGEANAKLRGYLPVNQTPSKLPTEQTERENGKKGWVIEPDMTFAYMVANKSVGTRGNVGLQFTSQMTALEFEIVASDIEQIPNEDPITHEIKILGVTLSHAGKEQIAGHFEYDYENYDFSNVEIEGADAHTNVSQMFPEGLLVDSKTGFVDVTFFVFPGVTFNDGNNDATEDKLAKDLELTVLYQIDGVPQNRTAKIRKQIEPKKKYFFADVQLPKIEANGVSASNWFNALNDNVLISQVSIPVASNVFANATYGFADKSVQQILSYTDLWDKGVRGFELVTRRTVEKTTSSWGQTKYSCENTWSLANAHFVCDEVPHESSNINFGVAFETLLGKLNANPSETLVLICTYQAISDGYDPNGYVQQLLNYFDDLIDAGKIKKGQFVQLHANSTVQDIRGKVCVIIRPGDDDRYESNAYTSGIQLKSNDGATQNDWSDKVLLIQDWGTAFDVWDRRYEGVARESTFETLYVIEKAKKSTTARPQIEDWLWGVSGSSSSYSLYKSDHDFNSGQTMPSKKSKFEYEHNMTGSSAKAYIQEWSRVIKEDVFRYAGKSVGSSSKRYLWFKWFESKNEKLKAIDGLFEMTVEEKVKKTLSLYINSLSGYYADWNIAPEGLYPFKETFSSTNPDALIKTLDFDISNQGKGGDHPGLAYDLNKHVYQILTRQKELSGGGYLKEGPWGLVMMEHIGNTAKGTDDKSLDLVNLIMLNNFKFPLATGVPDDGETLVTPPGGGGVQGE